MQRRKTLEQGSVLLGLILVMTVMVILLAAAVPDAKTQGQRVVEYDMYYKGEQMAEAIARYYGGGRLDPLGVNVKPTPPPWGYLTELKKLRDGVTIGTKEIRFVRPSAFIDPMTSKEWEPIRIGDPRIKPFLLAWSGKTERPIPQIYLRYVGGGAISGPILNPSIINNPSTPPNSNQSNEDEEDEEEDLEEEDEEDFDEEGEEGEENEEEPQKPPFQTPASGGANNASGLGNVTFEGGFGGSEVSTGPIIGVVSRSKRKAIVERFGIANHEEMIFIYMPPGVPQQTNQNTNRNPRSGNTRQ